MNDIGTFCVLILLKYNTYSFLYTNPNTDPNKRKREMKTD